MAIVRAGRLRERIQIQRQATATDAAGEPAGAWATVGTAWARVESLRSSEPVVAMKAEGRLTHGVWVRAGFSILPTDRLLWRGRVLEIVGPPRLDERRSLIELDATETA